MGDERAKDVLANGRAFLQRRRPSFKTGLCAKVCWKTTQRIGSSTFGVWGMVRRHPLSIQP